MKLRNRGEFMVCEPIIHCDQNSCHGPYIYLLYSWKIRNTEKVTSNRGAEKLISLTFDDNLFICSLPVKLLADAETSEKNNYLTPMIGPL